MTRWPVVAAALGGLAALGWWLSRPALPPDPWLGYVEGENIEVAAPIAGTLARLAVGRGARVNPGAPLFALEPTTSDADVARLASEAAAARARLAGLRQARQRPPDQARDAAAVAAARAQLVRAEADFARRARLVGTGAVSRAAYDTAREARDVAAARLAEAEQTLAAGRIAIGRASDVADAAASLAAAEAALRGQQRRRQEIAPAAPAAGVVEQTYFLPGEWVPANQPVLALLPDDRRKLRFFVPQGMVARLRLGQAVSCACDGCGAPRQARIRYIAPRAEYTPPVIYSDHARAKLVFLVEAALPTGQPLPLGLPVEIAPPVSAPARSAQP